jgi:ribonuclease P protein component
MLPKSQRLSRAAFVGYFAGGKRFHAPYLTIVYHPTASFQAAVVVSKKVAKKAHERNTIRRRLYAVLREVHKEEAVSGVYIVHTKPSFAALSREAQRQTFRMMLSRIPKER